ncbi:hypothetical protein NDU88_002159 [Pleurodeles waltl]|uniref:Uncharacterized protein n=1 Tax=Pleurodeles waltl TaxID=8319 RepID=A0AAV7UVC9_PLEWA|nr:hypothetical protein NDU88_002159 [Pleurodeles waltl]
MGHRFLTRGYSEKIIKKSIYKVKRISREQTLSRAAQEGDFQDKDEVRKIRVKYLARAAEAPRLLDNGHLSEQRTRVTTASYLIAIRVKYLTRAAEAPRLLDNGHLLEQRTRVTTASYLIAEVLKKSVGTPRMKHVLTAGRWDGHLLRIEL